MTAGDATIVAGAIAAASTLFSALGVLYLANRAEDQRAERSAAEKSEDRREGVRARLHADRVEAYREFTESYADYELKQDQAAQAWGSRQYRAGIVNDLSLPRADRDRAIKDFDAANVFWSDRAQEAHGANVRVIQALSLLEIVASTPVADAATKVIEVARESATAQRQVFDRPGEATPDIWGHAERLRIQVEEARIQLRAAIRAELQLDA